MKGFKLVHSSARAKCLAQYADKWGVKVNAIAEVGVYKGNFSSMLRKFFPEAFLYLVDPWAHIPELATKRGILHMRGGNAETNQTMWDNIYAGILRRFDGDTRVGIMRMTSAEAAPMVPDGVLDIAYIDADHQYERVQEDIRLWLPKVRPGGIICGHDYVPSRPRRVLMQVQRAVDDYFGAGGVEVGTDTLWVRHVR